MLSRTGEFRMVWRARIILKCLRDDLAHQIAKLLHLRPNTLIKWRHPFAKEGMCLSRQRS